MTNELAIRILTGDVLGTSEQTQEAIEMAVKALSQPDVPDTNVGDMISRQDAINLLKKWSDGYKYIETETELAIKDFQHLPSAQSEKRTKEPCWVCENLENGDTLYSTSDWDGGIGFDYIRDIKYCPVCGRKL